MIRSPADALKPFVKDLWVADHRRPPAVRRFHEHALPEHRHCIEPVAPEEMQRRYTQMSDD